MKQKKQYLAPKLTVVEVKVERGYAVSGPVQTFSLVGLVQAGYNDQCQQNWEAGDDLFGGEGW